MISPEASAAVVGALVDRAEIAAVSVRYATALDRREWSLLRSCFATNAIVDHAIGCLREHADQYADRPFFQYVAVIAPHVFPPSSDQL